MLPNEGTALEDAVEIALTIHTGQFRKGPHQYPYITHPITVSHTQWLTTDRQKALAILHDVLEDAQSEKVLSALEFTIRTTFGGRFLSDLRLLTKPKTVFAGDYIRNIALAFVEETGPYEADPLLVKLADIAHNSRYESLHFLEDRTRRIKKYYQAVVMINTILRVHSALEKNRLVTEVTNELLNLTANTILKFRGEDEKAAK